MRTIFETVQTSMTDAGYLGYLNIADPVINALQEREDQIVSGLREVAEGKGLSESETNALLTHVGLLQPVPVVEEPVQSLNSGDTGEDFDVQAAIERLTEQVQALRQAAQRHGVTV